jgi:hypothetical protein
MSNKKQTAVHWLVSQLQKTRDWQRVINEANQSGSSVRDVIEQAKEMERQQIIDACNQIEVFGADHELPGEQYYKETYGE